MPIPPNPTPADDQPVSSLNFYLGLFVITACTLMLQLVQTRILSVVAWYHLAFFAISMAMFGLTAGAVWVYLRRDRFSARTFSHDMAYFATGFAVTTALCLAVQMTISPVVFRTASGILTWVELSLLLSIPFFFSGVVVSLALTRSPFPIGRVYGVDMVGAAVGCLGVLVVLNSTDGPSAVLLVAAMAAGGAWLLSGSGIGGTPEPAPPLSAVLGRPGSVCLVLSLLALGNSVVDYGLQPLVVKGTFEGNGALYTRWNSFSRVAVLPGVNEPPAMWGPSPRLSLDSMRIDQRRLNIDGDAGTVAYRFQDPRELDFLRFDVTNLAYYMPNQERAAVIGVGAGRDMLSAWLSGVRDVTGVEINPIFVRLLTAEGGLGEYSPVARMEGMRFVLDDGRSWFARSTESFDVIQMSMVDTWAATGAGAFTLSENGLYTVEAWNIFLDHLTPNGAFTVSRWYSTAGETGRLISLAVATLRERGAENPRDHILLASQGRVATLVLSREPFSDQALAALENISGQLLHTILMSPNVEPDSEVLQTILQPDASGAGTVASGHFFDLTAPTDNRPFFFNQVPLGRPLEAIAFARQWVGSSATLGGVRAGNLVATATLIILFIIALLLVIATIIIPLRPGLKDVGGRLAAGGTSYFMLIGVGFMMVEIGLLQRMSVFLGHPIYSLAIVLFSLILSTGLGSLVSDRLPLDSRRKFVAWALGMTTSVAILLTWLPPVLLRHDSSPLVVRCLICVLSLVPVGLLAGFGFPTGMRLVETVDRRPTPWFWGINGAAGVLASIVAIGVSIAYGINVTLGLGALCYLALIPVALGLMWPQVEAS